MKKSFNSGWKTSWKQPAPCCKFNLTYTSLRQKHFHSTIDSQVMSRTAVWIQSRMFIPANGIQGQLLIYGDKDIETGSLYTSRWFNWAKYLENLLGVWTTMQTIIFVINTSYHTYCSLWLGLQLVNSLITSITISSVKKKERKKSKQWVLFVCFSI